MVYKKKCAGCQDCPYHGGRAVFGWSESSKPKLIVVGEGLSDKGEERPFDGYRGRTVQHVLSKEKVAPYETYYMDIIGCFPGWKINKDEYAEAVAQCIDRFIDEIKEVVKAGDVKAIITMGPKAAEVFGITQILRKVRGYPHQKMVAGRQVTIIPTYSPTYLIRGNMGEDYIWASDIEKACNIAIDGWNPPLTDVQVLEESPAKIASIIDKIIKSTSYFALDIETTALEPDQGDIKCIGIGLYGARAYVIPFMRMGRPIWSDLQRGIINKKLIELMKTGRGIWHNGYFDLFWLEWHGFRGVKDFKYNDTMLLHHCINAEAYHNLAYVASIYTMLPYWKDIKFDADTSEDKIMDVADDDKLFLYNGLDCIATLEAFIKLEKDARDMDVWKVYQNTDLPMAAILIEMRLNGLPYHKKSAKKVKETIMGQQEESVEIMKDLIGANDDFSFTKDMWVRRVLYNETTGSYWDMARAEKKRIEGLPEAKRDRALQTKKWIANRERLDVLRCFPLRLPNGFKPNRTEGRASALDELALNNVIRACSQRILTIQEMKRPPKGVKEEAEELKETIEFTTHLMRWKKNQSMVANHLGVRVWADGRVRGELRQTGTSTGRLSSKNPNMQNMNEIVKGMFEEDEDHILIKRDYVNLEVFLMAYISGCKNLIHAHKNGINVHDMNTYLWGVDETHPKWKPYRKAEKGYIFGTAYEARWESLYQTLLSKEPDLPVSREEFRRFDEVFRKENPEIFAWHERTNREVAHSRIMRNAVGRVRIFHGPDKVAIGREAANMQIQSLAYDLAAKGMIEFYQKAPKNWKLLLNTHDDILVSAPKAQAKEANELLKECMEQTLFINGEYAKFLTDGKIGKNLSEKEVTNQKDGLIPDEEYFKKRR